MGRHHHTQRELGRGRALGQLLKRAREAKGLSQQEVARRSGLAMSTVRNLERGNTPNPGFFTLLACSRALGLELAQIEAMDAPRGRASS